MPKVLKKEWRRISINTPMTRHGRMLPTGPSVRVARAMKSTANQGMPCLPRSYQRKNIYMASTIIDVSTMWGGSILLGALCAFVLKLPVEAVYVVLMSDEVIKVPITTLRYRQKKWLRNVTREL